MNTCTFQKEFYVGGAQDFFLLRPLGIFFSRLVFPISISSVISLPFILEQTSELTERQNELERSCAPSLRVLWNHEWLAGFIACFWMNMYACIAGCNARAYSGQQKWVLSPPPASTLDLESWRTCLPPLRGPLHLVAYFLGAGGGDLEFIPPFSIDVLFGPLRAKGIIS